MLLTILEAASGDDAALRNILFDPTLLGAARSSGDGKLYPDTRNPDAPNIAKMVNSFCIEEWGCGVRAAILDNGKPARRSFCEAAPEEEKVPPHIYERNPEVPKADHDARPQSKRTLDWRTIARAMRDRGWRSHFTTEELDSLL